MKGVIIKKLDTSHDTRGWLSEIYREDEINHKVSMAYVSMTEPYVTRGPHEHLFQTDMFYFMGKIELHLWDNREDSDTYGEHSVLTCGYDNYLVIVPPRVVHAYRNVTPTPAIVVNMPDKLYKGEGKASETDEIRHENREDSKFKIEGV